MPNGVPFCTRFGDVFTAVPGGCSFLTPQQLSGTWCTAPASPTFDGNEFSTLALTQEFGAAIKTDGTLWTWGRGLGGMLGTNNTISRSSPVQTISGGTNWRQVMSSAAAIGAIKSDGTLWGWGYNSDGQLGTNNRNNQSSPVQTISGGTNWCKIASGSGTTRSMGAIKSDGTLWVWGYNGRGMLGDNSIICRSSPVQMVSGGTNWKQASIGINNIAAIKTDGTLWLTGGNSAGTLGDNRGGNYSNASSPVQTISGGTNWRVVCMGNSTVGGIKTDGTLWMWGVGGYGQRGDNSTQFQMSSPVQTVSGGTDWRSVAPAGGYGLTFAVKNNGQLWWWGRNRYGMGSCVLPQTTYVSSPVQSTATGCWSHIGSVTRNTIGVLQNGSLFTWGRNNYGSLGINVAPGTLCERTFADVGNFFVEKDYLLDVYPQLACNFKASALWSWGNNCCGALGNYSTSNQSSPIQTISGGTNWKQLSGGKCGTAGIKTDGTLWVWGTSSNGLLGNNLGSFNNSSSPVQTISGGNNWKQVSSNIVGYHRAAIKTDGTLWLWGAGGCGQLGNNAAGSTAQRSSPIQTISAGTDWKQVSVFAGTTAAIKTNGTLWLWGYNTRGNLGDNTVTFRSSPVQTISGGTNWKMVCQLRAIKTDGTFWAWGNNSCGDLGDGTVANRSSPVQTISGGTNWKTIGGFNSAIKTDGTLWTWGSGTTAGNGSDCSISSPVQTISGGTNWKCVAGSYGFGFRVALKSDGTLWGWGYNSTGSPLGCNAAPGTIFCSPIQLFQDNNWKTVTAGTYHTSAIREEGDW